ncbi:hypothetical protein Q5P01_018723 [Channa striata]|uniref:G-protein coupled receptors family 1 profile domain-containing protein n=1 Tax=Channa striata TaxID=64152 RepID=A0AA88M6B1_CHASR|nr:hypothetical protein Q5P01_018723 [Channa striata]
MWTTQLSPELNKLTNHHGGNSSNPVGADYSNCCSSTYRILRSKGDARKVDVVKIRRDGSTVLELGETEEFERDNERPTRSVEPESSRTALSRAFQAEIGKQVNEIKESVLFNLTDSEQTLLQSESSLDILIVADDVAKLIVQNLKGRDSTPKTKRRSKPCKDRVMSKLKTFLVKYLVKSSMLYALIQLKARFIQLSAAESKDSMCSFMDSVEFLLLRDIDENNKGANEECVFSKLEEMFSGELEPFSEALTDLLYTHLENKSLQSTSEAPLDGALYAAIGAKVKCCLDLTKRWINTRAAAQSERVMCSVVAKNPLAETLLLNSTSEMDDSEARLRTLITMLVKTTYKKARIPHRLGKPEDIVDHLLEKTWAELQDIDFEIREETFKQLSKAIFKHLSLNFAGNTMSPNTSLPGPILKASKNEETAVDIDAIMNVVTIVFYSITVVLGITGNSIVIWVAGFKLKPKVTNVWLVNLAIADLIFCFTRVFSLTKKLFFNQWPFGIFVCKFNGFFKYANMFCSVFLLAVISLDRVLCIWQPIATKRRRTLCVARVVAACVWITAIGLSTPYFIHRQVYLAKNNLSKCSVDPKEAAAADSGGKHILYSIRFLCGFMLPFLVILICYILAGIGIRRTRLAGKSRPLRILASLVIAFFLCWAPHHCLLLVKMVDSKSKVVKIWSPLASGIAYFNSCVNPLLYFCMGLDMRGRFKQSLAGVYRRALADDVEGQTTQSNERSLDDTSELKNMADVVAGKTHTDAAKL